jgi:hypothetical protein
MKQVRRVTVEIEQRTLTLSVGGSQAAEDTQPQPPSIACALCGSPWLLLQGTLRSDGDVTLKGMENLLATEKLHLQGTPEGSLWICQRSLQRFITSKSTETL